MWATGILAYELVVGRPPFEVNDEVQTATMIMFSNNVVYPPKHSALWADFVKVALEKKPHIRPTALQMLDHPWYAIAFIASICISRQHTCMHTVLVGLQHGPVSRDDDNLSGLFEISQRCQCKLVSGGVCLCSSNSSSDCLRVTCSVQLP